MQFHFKHVYVCLHAGMYHMYVAAYVIGIYMCVYVYMYIYI